MEYVQIKTNLSASLVDQLLPGSEGFQMLQSISVETKYLQSTASNIQLKKYLMYTQSNI